jgi:Lrp/AsnC family transcriptional regulator, leucine-responsive regulatory protein
MNRPEDADCVLDHLDRAILRKLYINSRTPIVEIARSVRCANATCHTRIKKLLANGYIENYTIRLGRDKTRSLNFKYFLIAATQQNDQTIKNLASWISEQRGVIMVDKIEGRHDIIVKIGFRSNEEGKIIREKIGRHDLCKDLTTITCIESFREHEITIDYFD